MPLKAWILSELACVNSVFVTFVFYTVLAPFWKSGLVMWDLHFMNR